MSTWIKAVLLVATILSLSLVFAPTSHAALTTVGPIDPATTFPAFYQDTTGLSLAPCFDNNGFCANTMVAAPGFDPALPIAFPLNFPPEGFYFFAQASFVDPKMLYIAALEFSFANGVVRAGDQITFARIRIKNATLTTPGATVTVMHPYGADTITVDPNKGLLFFTEDLGLGGPPFTGALAGRIDPFLKTAAGLVKSPDGNVYIGNSVTPVVVTGTPVTTVTVAGAINATANTFILEGKVIGMSVTPTAIVFPAQRPAPFVSAPVPVMVTNLNTVNALSIASIVSQGANAADFQIADVNCLTGPIGPAGSCTFNVTLSGAAAGPAARTASIITSATQGIVPMVVMQPVTGIIDTVPPTVISTFPNTATAPANVNITVTFSESMAPATINATTFLVSSNGAPLPGLPAPVYSDANKTASIALPAAQEQALFGTVITAQTTTGMTDLVGNPLSTAVTFSFTALQPDLTPPAIVSITPPNNATGVRTDAPIIVTFSEPMLSTSITGSVIQVTSGGVPVDGAVTVASNVAKFTPARPLAFGTVFTITITTGALDLASNALAAGQVINFLTNFAPSTPVPISPANGAAGLSTAVTLTWTKATDDDGDSLSYKVFICNNPAFFGCSAVVVTASAPRVNAAYFAGLGGIVMALFGLVSIGGIKGRKPLMLLLAIAAMTGAVIYSCGGSGGGGDTTPPSVPAGVTATAVSADQIDLAWTASSDNVGVTGYTVYRGVISLASITAGTSTSVSGLSPSTNYCFTVNARDAAGNESAQSNPACATTQSGAVSPVNQMSFTATGLNSAAHYYWKVVADDGKGGIAESAVWSFTTQ